MRNFKNQAERAFYDYMGSHTKRKESTIWSYILRLRGVKSLDVLITENIDSHIANYESGSMKSKNDKCHSAYSCALKHFKEYMQHEGLV